MPGVLEVWYSSFLGNPLGAWALALVTFLITFTLLPLAQRFISARRAASTSCPASRPARSHDSSDLRNHSSRPQMTGRRASSPIGSHWIREARLIRLNSIVR